MMPGNLARAVRHTLYRFTGDAHAMAAVEFAMLLPLMLLLYLGGIEVSQAVSADRKVTLVSRTVADLISQAPNVDDTYMNNVLAAATAVSTPFGIANLTVTVSSVVIDGSGNAKIVWSDSMLNGNVQMPGSVHAKNAAMTFKSNQTALKVNGTSLIWAEVSYSYKPAIGYGIVGNLTLHDEIFMRPRLITCIPRKYNSDPTTYGSC